MFYRFTRAKETYCMAITPHLVSVVIDIFREHGFDAEQIAPAEASKAFAESESKYVLRGYRGKMQKENL